LDFISEIFAPVQLLAWVAGTLYFISYQSSLVIRPFFYGRLLIFYFYYIIIL